MRGRHRVTVPFVVCAALLAASCSSGDDPPAERTATTERGARAAAAPVTAASLGIDLTNADRCDPLVPTECLLPFPSDRFTVPDDASPTKRRIRFARESLPANSKGVRVDPADWNRSDGFSPGSPILVDLPGVDLDRSKPPAIGSIERSLERDSALVVLDATTGTRWPAWLEADSLADGPGSPWLLVQPARNFVEGHRIVVALRRMVDGAGVTLQPSPAFRAYRDGQRTTDEGFERRRDAMERVFADLGRAGVRRADLQLAWDFTVASTDGITGRLRAIRDDAFASLGDAAPPFAVTGTTEAPNPQVARYVRGTFRMPLYLTGAGEPGARLVLDDRGRPQRQQGEFTAEFECTIPPRALKEPARMAIYGHGLLGSRDEIEAPLVRDFSAAANVAVCATDFAGMSGNDLVNAATVLGDLSTFGSVPDRLHQGLLAFLMLGRLMLHDQGFAADPAFQRDGRPLIDGENLFYDGNSQGAILGGAVCAVAQDLRRCVLGEAGMNYAFLLDRSVDFDDYLTLAFRPAYPRRGDRIIGQALMSMLWDRVETNGYAAHLTRDPLPDTPKKDVLLLGAVGDHQVSEYSLRTQARTMRVPARLPLAGTGRVAEIDPAWGFERIDRFPHRGSAFVLVDTGSPPSPAGNVPPREGRDPHDDTPNIPEIQTLKDQFFRGELTDPCAAGAACTFPVPAANAG